MDAIIGILFVVGLFFSMNSVLYESGAFFVVWGSVGAFLAYLKYMQIQRNKAFDLIAALHTKAEIIHDAHTYAKTLARIKPHLDNFVFDDAIDEYSQHIGAVCTTDDVAFNNISGYRFTNTTQPEKKLSDIHAFEQYLKTFIDEWDEEDSYNIPNADERLYRFILNMDDLLYWHFIRSSHSLLHFGFVHQDNLTIVERSPLAGFLKTTDRFKHQYVLGKTGSGKSVLLRHQLTQDVHNGYGIVLMTPERGLIDDVLRYIPDERKDDVVFINPADDTNPIIGFNPFALDANENLVQKAGELETIFIRALGEMGVSMRPLLSNTIYAIMQGGLSISDFPKLIDPYDTTHRHALLARGVLDERTADFFVKYDKSAYYKKSYEPIVNRLDALLRPPLVNVLTTTALDFKTVLNHKNSIVLCNLSALRGSQAEIVGQLLLATFQQTFFQRDHMEEQYRKPYFFYMDEFQTYATANQVSLKDFLTRARKYKVGICMAHQNIKDIPTELSASIFGNCGTLVGMLMSADDASRFKKEAQLKNFDDLEDAHGARAQIQLQNFEPGMCAITTPQNKKAFIARVPEHPVFDAREQVAELEALSKQNYGVARTTSPPPKQEQKQQSPPHDKHQHTPEPEAPKEFDPNDLPDDEGEEDEFTYRFS